MDTRIYDLPVLHTRVRGVVVVFVVIAVDKQPGGPGGNLMGKYHRTWGIRLDTA